MIEINNETVFGKIIAECLAKVENDGSLTSGKRLRWISAINNAVNLFDRQKYFVTYDRAADVLVVWSDSNNSYTVGKTCECKAAVMFGEPCKHIALKRILKRYLDAVDAQVLESEIVIEKCAYCSREAVSGKNFCENHSPYLKPTTERKPEKIGNFRI